MVVIWSLQHPPASLFFLVYCNSMDGPLSIFYFLVLILSIIVHEVAHGLAAEREGDPTARLLGRITLNPLKHIDWLGSIVLPLILILTKAGIVLGWAKPVPYDPDKLRRGNKSVAIVSIAGIVANIAIAVFFGLVIRAAIAFGFATGPIIEISSIIVLINSILALFNMTPLAPLDGFRFLQAVLPISAQQTLRFIEEYSLWLLLAYIFFGWGIVAPIAFSFYTALTGIGI